MIKIIFTDIDQTLLSHRTYSVPASAIYALRKVKEKGIMVFGCTGRSLVELRNMPLTGFDPDGYVSVNGCYNFDREGDISLYPITARDKEILIHDADKYDIAVQIMLKERKFSNHYSEEMKKGLAAIHTELDDLDELEKIRDEEVLMFIPWAKPAVVQCLFTDLKDTDHVQWNPYAADCFRRGAGKGKGINDILKKYHLTADQAMAFGDAPNDLSMFKACGTTIAMGNADPEVKERASFVTKDINDDGMAHALKYFGLID